MEPGFAGVLGLACALGGAVLKGAARVCTVWASGTGSGSDIYPPSATLPFELTVTLREPRATTGRLRAARVQVAEDGKGETARRGRQRQVVEEVIYG